MVEVPGATKISLWESNRLTVLKDDGTVWVLTYGGELVQLAVTDAVDITNDYLLTNDGRFYGRTGEREYEAFSLPPQVRGVRKFWQNPLSRWDLALLDEAGALWSLGPTGMAYQCQLVERTPCLEYMTIVLNPYCLEYGETVVERACGMSSHTASMSSAYSVDVDGSVSVAATQGGLYVADGESRLHGWRLVHKFRSRNLTPEAIGGSDALDPDANWRGVSYELPEVERLSLEEGEYFSFDQYPSASSSYHSDYLLYSWGKPLADGVIGSGVDLSGSLDSYVEVANSVAISPDSELSVSFWVKVDGVTNSYIALVYKSNQERSGVTGYADRSYSIWARSDGGLHMSATGVGANAQTYCDSPPGLLSLHQFFHVAAVVDAPARSMKLYLNGDLVADCEFPFDSIRNGDAPLRIGAPSPPADPDEGGLNGVIDELYVERSALDATEIRARYLSEGGVRAGRIVAWAEER